MHLAVSRMGVHVGPSTLQGDVSADLRARVAADGVSTEVSGSTVSLDHVRGRNFSDWWAKATIERGAVRGTRSGWSGGLSLHVGASDARPAAPFVSRATGVPEWVIGILSLPNLAGDGELRFASRSFDMRDVVVRGESSWLRLELLKRRGATRGLVLVHQGPLEVGFGLGAETPKLLLFGGEQWFASRKLTLHTRELEL